MTIADNSWVVKLIGRGGGGGVSLVYSVIALYVYIPLRLGI